MDRDSDPKTLAILEHRGKHQDEIDLEKEIQRLSSRASDLENAIETGKTEEQRRMEQRKAAEKKSVKLGETKQSSTMVSRLRDAVRTTLGDFDEDGYEVPKPERLAKKGKYEVELEQLRALKRAKEDDLNRVIKREDALFEKEKRKVAKSNEQLLQHAENRRSKKIKTLKLAIQFEWNRSKIEDLGQKLDRIRNSLYSEVMLHNQASVGRIEKGQTGIRDLLDAQTSHLQHMDGNASQSHDDLMQAIKSFSDDLKEGKYLFPAIPKILTDVDPSLKSPALSGYDVIENSVLSALYFRKMDTREAQVSEAHSDTFSWIFEDPNEEGNRTWSNFRAWLEGEGGCYWIEGKAGCGKSTLMKFLVSDPRTLAALNRWAGISAELITASYYCWRAGTDLQRNQEGLLRSLLHNILSQRRDLIARVFPRQYNAMMTR